VVNVEAVYRALTNRLNRGVPLDEDLVWDAIHSTVDKLGLRRKSELILPMRHALTGRLVRVAYDPFAFCGASICAVARWRLINDPGLIVSRRKDRACPVS
jgi:hypothetical protein